MAVLTKLFNDLWAKSNKTEVPERHKVRRVRRKERAQINPLTGIE